MASKRMFSRDIVESDQFADMQPLTQVLYFRFGLVADDDGIVANYKTVMRGCGATTENYNELLSNGYVIPFDEYRVIVITHWKINNYIRSDRYNPTIYQDVIKRLDIEDGIYKLPHGIPSGIPKVYIGKNREDKGSIDKGSIGEGREEQPQPPAQPDIDIKCYGDHNRVEMTEKDYKDLIKQYGFSVVLEYISKADKAGEKQGRNIDKAYAYISRMIEADKPKIDKQQDKDNNRSMLHKIEDMYLDEVKGGIT